jgi:hypothetical protein
MVRVPLYRRSVILTCRYRPSEEKYEAVSWFPGCKKARLALESDDPDQTLLHGKKVHLFGKNNESSFPKASIRAMIKDLGGALAASDTSCDYVISAEPMPADEKRKAPVVNAKVCTWHLYIMMTRTNQIASLVVVRRH